jgi:hypothetical protein
MKIRKELWFGLGIMGLIVLGRGPRDAVGQPDQWAAWGLLMLALVVVAIMLGIPDRLHADGYGYVVCVLRGFSHRGVNPGPGAAARCWT